MASYRHTTCSFFLGQKHSGKGNMSIWEKSVRICGERIISFYTLIYFKLQLYVSNSVNPGCQWNIITLLRNWTQCCSYIVLFGEYRFLNVYKINNVSQTSAGGSPVFSKPLLLSPTARAGMWSKSLDGTSKILPLAGLLMDDLCLKIPHYFLSFLSLCSCTVSQEKLFMS